MAAAAGGAATEEVDLNKHPSGIIPTLQNVVATVNLGCKLELKEIALHARNAEYNPKRFAAVIMRIREPKTTALVFASGKMVCTGAKSEEDSRMAARKYAKIIQKLGFNATFKEFKIQNIVGSCDVKFPIRLEGLSFAQQMFSSYEPELFPGLIFRMKVPKVVLLIFVSGKVVLTGAKQRGEIYQAFENIYPVLQEFRKGDAAVPMPVPAAGAGAAPALPGPVQPQLPAPPAPAAAAQQQQAMPPPPAPQQQQQQQQQQQEQAVFLPPPSPPRGAHLPPPTPHHHGMNLPPPTPHNH